MRRARRFFGFVITVASVLSLLSLSQIYPADLETPVFAASPVITLYGSAPDAPDSQLQAIIEEVVSDLPGTWGVAVKKLDTGQYAAYNGDRQQVSASLYKMWVLAELYHQVAQGTVSLEDPVAVSGEDAAYDASLNELRLPAGTGISLRQAAYLMVTVSDNTAAHLLVRVLGPDNVNRFMRQSGLTHSVLDWGGVGDNLTTPLDMLREMEMIATSDMVNQDASQDMIKIMLDQQINNLLPPGLPDAAQFAHKTGALDNLLHDAGIVFSPAGPYVIVAMSSELDDYGTAWNAMPELSKRVYNYFNARRRSPALYFPESKQSVAHDFLKFWNVYGGLERFGYPLTPEYLQGDIVVQQFERARLEWHPENAGAGGPQPQVVLGLIGQERAGQLGLTWPRSPETGDGKYFQATGQVLQGAFLDYWNNNGGERAFGIPISPASGMQNPSDGKTYLTQWFQRVRMELHPELPAGKQVVLGAIGSEMQAGR